MIEKKQKMTHDHACFINTNINIKQLDMV